jgi:gamma-glutamyltranspeptidase/glutathione hydrolase/leukotriene-C4 hydrolase
MFKNRSSVLGGLATAIPGDLYGLWEAHKIGGKLLWSELVQPTIDLCRNGFKVPTALANVFVKAENYLRSDKGLRDMFINKETNQIYKKDEIIKLPKLARTFELIRDSNISAFYDGVLTQDIVDEINASGGNVTVEDFKAYRPVVGKPITVDLNEQYKLYTSSLPSSGVIVSFILKLMSGFNSTSSDEKSNVLFLHRLTEAFKHSYAHRALLGDQDTEEIREVNLPYFCLSISISLPYHSIWQTKDNAELAKRKLRERDSSQNRRSASV